MSTISKRKIVRKSNEAVTPIKSGPGTRATLVSLLDFMKNNGIVSIGNVSKTTLEAVIADSLKSGEPIKVVGNKVMVTMESMKVKRRRTRRANESFGSPEDIRQAERMIIINDHIRNDLVNIEGVMDGRIELDWVDSSTLKTTNGVHTFDGMIRGSVCKFEVRRNKSSRNSLVVKVDGVLQV